MFQLSQNVCIFVAATANLQFWVWLCFQNPQNWVWVLLVECTNAPITFDWLKKQKWYMQLSAACILRHSKVISFESWFWFFNLYKVRLSFFIKTLAPMYPWGITGLKNCLSGLIEAYLRECVLLVKWKTEWCVTTHFLLSKSTAI